ncbi:MAG: hypothetical protein DCC74_08975 [Proteobacteria bacterium]|nr:MAG: hypothetical protein DCC74_08975 [Pseudomonadota bacterium]
MLARTPWTPRAAEKATRRRLNKDRRRHLVATVANILEAGEPTKFAFEASCRHGIRSSLCAQGWRWQEADAIAADIVATALRSIGTQRPTWQQGQPEWTQEGFAPVLRTRCAHCGRQLPEIDGTNRIYCSEVCSSVRRSRLTAIRRANEDTVHKLLAGGRKSWVGFDR